jgi:transcriptional regulator with XRE-family HTH domain
MTMHQIRSGQIKAARAILNWSQEDMASATGLSITTIRNLELGSISPRHSTYDVIRIAVESAGLEFIEPEGVRRRLDEVKVFQGHNSCDLFYDDMLQTVRKKGGEIAAFMKSRAMLALSCGTSPHGGSHTRFERLSDHAEMKCIVSHDIESVMTIPGVQFRMISKHFDVPVPYYVYGDKHVLVLIEGGVQYKFVVFDSAGLAQSYRSHFLTLWETAAPLLTADKTEVRVTAGR